MVGGRPVRRRGPVTSPAGAARVAAIDCGTNSLRLLIADVDPLRRALADVDRRMEIVRLGQGVDATGRLAPEALDRTLAVLADYGAAIRDASASAVRMVATSATRDAGNAAEFVGGVRRILGITPEVLTGDEEAALSYTGATAELAAPWVAALGVGALGAGALGVGAPGAGAPGAAAPGQAGPDVKAEPPYLVVDIGGGSTEFVLGGQDPTAPLARAAHAISVNIGCVRLTERHLHGDPPSADQISAAEADIDAALDRVAAAIPATTARTLIGLAGSVTTVTGIALGLAAYDPAVIHHARVTAERVHEVTLELLGQTRAERARIGVMHPGRVDVIGAGALVLDRAMGRLGFASVLASEHDILDGIAWSLVNGGR
jgi:exopolyphosphatase / guanosine-5'-triphosphate,3'-diphosphate pyrophosphatase